MIECRQYEEPYDDMIYTNRSILLSESETDKFMNEIYSCMVYDFLTDEDIKAILKICDIRLNDITDGN